MFSKLDNDQQAKAIVLSTEKGWSKEISALVVLAGVDTDADVHNTLNRELAALTGTKAQQADAKKKIETLTAEITETQKEISALMEGEKLNVTNMAGQHIRLSNRLFALRQQLTAAQAQAS